VKLGSNIDMHSHAGAMGTRKSIVELIHFIYYFNKK